MADDKDKGRQLRKLLRIMRYIAKSKGETQPSLETQNAAVRIVEKCKNPGVDETNRKGA